MAAITPTLVQVHNTPYSVASGSAEKRIAKIYLEATSTATSNTIDLASYVTNVSGIVAIEGNSLDAADASNDTALNTWSGTTITFAGHAGSGVWKMSLIAYF